MKDDNSVKYWVAGHLTSFFYISDSQTDILQKGSRGAGFNIDQGVITEVLLKSDETEIYFDNIKQDQGSASVSESVLKLIEEEIGKKLPPLNINHKFQVPLDAGFGTSAAGAVGLAFSINELLNLNLSNLKLWQIAHIAEIHNTTGFGDVLGLYCNAPFELRLKEGAPDIGEVRPLMLDVQNYSLFTLSKGSLSTKTILSNPDRRREINDFGLIAVNNILNNQTFESFIFESTTFSNNLNILSKELRDVKDALKENYLVSQIMLGNSLFVFVQKSQIDDFLSLQKENNWIYRNLTFKTLKKMQDL